MGCDIHTMAEVRYTYNGQEEWYALEDPVFPNLYYNPAQPIRGYNYPYGKEPYSGRNYRLFSLLADVRNSEGITPIKEPVGVPGNASEEWRKYVKEWGSDLHSLTYYTLQELVDAEADGLFDQTIHETGFVTIRQYMAYRDAGDTPDTWSSFVGGGGIKTGTVEEYEAGNTDLTHLEMTWDWPMSDAVKFFRDSTIPALKLNVPNREGFEGIRIMIGFDN